MMLSSPKFVYSVKKRMLKWTLVIIIDLTASYILPAVEENDCKNMEILTRQVITKYYSSHKCIILISAEEMFQAINTDLTSSIIQITPKMKECDYGLADIIAEGFKQNCDGYIVQMENPLCILQIWHISLQMTFYRHNPKFFFIPDCKENRSYVEEIFSAPESDITVNIVAAEIESNFTNMHALHEDWPVTLWTNDFSNVGHKKLFVDSWHPAKGFRFNNNLFSDQILNLKGRVLRVAIFTYSPYTIVEEDSIDGTETRIVQEFCHLYNCTIKPVYDNGLWGSVQGNGSGDGILGMVYKDEADVAIGGVYLWLDPAYYLDYSDASLHAAVTLLVPKPVPLSGWRVPFLPFDLAMWAAMCLSLAISSIVIYFAYWLINKKNRYVARCELLNVKDVILIVLGMSVLQPPSKYLGNNHASINQMVTSVAILCLLLSSCYSAGLSSYLTVPQYTKPIDTFDELSESGLQWLAIHEAWVYSLQEVEDEKVQAVVKKFRKLPEERLLEEARKGKYGLAIERLQAGNFAEQSHFTDEVISKSHVMKENLYGSPLVVALRKGSPFTYRLNTLINILVNSGIIYYWEGAVSRQYLNTRKQMALTEARSARSKTKPTNLKLSHVQGAFIIYVVGILLSSCTVFIEIYRFKKYRTLTIIKVHPYLGSHNY